MTEPNLLEDQGPIPDQFLDAIKVDNNDLSFDEDDELDVKLDQASGNFQSEVAFIDQETIRRPRQAQKFQLHFSETPKLLTSSTFSSQHTCDIFSNLPSFTPYFAYASLPLFAPPAAVRSSVRFDYTERAGGASNFRCLSSIRL